MRPIFKFMWLVLFIIVGVYLLLHVLSIKKYPVEYGISFSKEHAESLSLDWKDVYIAMLDDLKPKYIRISATWKEVEKNKGSYVTEEIDWQMEEAKKRGVNITLVVGQKAPRWPECHVPNWTIDLSKDEYRQKLFAYVEYIVDRYKNNEALELWQVENEPFIRFKFGECKNFEKELVPEEIELVKSLDQNHKVMITDSGEMSTWRRASKYSDILGSTLYRVVRMPGGKIFNYDWLPASVYRYKAKIWGNKMEDFYISELQAEPWFTDSEPVDTEISVQEETMNLDRLKKNFEYVERIGTPRAYLWGVEWWYWMKIEKEKPEYWEFIQSRIKSSNS